MASATVRKYSELIGWQKAMDLVADVYAVSRQFPKEELYGLTSQLRRAVVSVPSNIAEGQSRSGTRDFLRYLSIARGSLSEVETQLMIAHRLGYMTQDRLDDMLQASYEVGSLIHGLSVAIEKRLAPDSPLATRHSPLQ